MSEEIDSALDEIFGERGGEPEAQNFLSDEPAQQEEEQLLQEAEPEAQDEPAEDTNPPGYISYNDWAAAGKNPDDWQGKNKFSEYHDLEQSINGLKRDSAKQAQAMTDALAEIKKQSFDAGMASAQQDLADAREAEDIDGALRAQKKINEMEVPQANQARQMHPVHEKFFGSNAVLDRSSPNFNADLFGEFARLYDSQLIQDGVQQDQQLSDMAIKGYTQKAMRSIQSLHPDYFESPKNARRAAPKAQQRRASKEPVAGSRVGQYKVANPRNTRDTNAAQEIYDMLEEMTPGGGAAFEKSLLRGS